MRYVLGAVLALAAGVAMAHGPTRQKVVESVQVAASPEAVWARIKDFDAIKAWHPAVESSSATDGNNVGSIRTLTLKGGGQVIEELEAYSDADRKMSYRMKDPGPVPVGNYTSTIAVKPDEGTGSIIEWRGAFYRGYPNNDPPPDKNDEAALKAVTDIYQSGLNNLKQLLQKP